MPPQTLGTADGTDGLQLIDFRKAKMTERGLRFRELPAILYIRKTLSSQHSSRYTCVSEEGLTYINEYLARRMHEGERVGPLSPLISPDHLQTKQNRFVPTTLIEKALQEAIVNAGFSWKPQILLEYFETNMKSARRHGKITPQDLGFFLSHIHVNGQAVPEHDELSPEVLNRRRLAYDKCKPYLSTVSYPLPPNTLLQESNGWIYI